MVVTDEYPIPALSMSSSNKLEGLEKSLTLVREESGSFKGCVGGEKKSVDRDGVEVQNVQRRCPLNGTEGVLVQSKGSIPKISRDMKCSFLSRVHNFCFMDCVSGPHVSSVSFLLPTYLCKLKC